MTLNEETYEELNYLLREVTWDDYFQDRKILIASGEDLFDQEGFNLYAVS